MGYVHCPMGSLRNTTVPTSDSAGLRTAAPRDFGRNRGWSAPVRWGSALTCGALALALTLTSGDASGAGGQDDAEQGLAKAFRQAGVIVEREAEVMAFPATVEVRDEPLEYLLVNPHGQVHESMLVTPIDAQVLSTAFLTVGAEQGQNVQYKAVDPPPSKEEVQSGARTHSVVIPSGKPLYLYASWREGAGVFDEESGTFPDETVHFHRMEDLILDLKRLRTLRRHGLVWLGSRMVEGRTEDEPKRFAASATGNLMCITFFSQGDTLLTMAVPECASQVDWVPNQFLLPERGTEILVIASSKQLEVVPDSLRKALPFAAETQQPR